MNESNSPSSVRDQLMQRAREVAGVPPTPQLSEVICPYCGTLTMDTGLCHSCAGRFDALSKQATQNQMGPWAIRDEQQSFRPGCSLELIQRLAKAGSLKRNSVVRGPTTNQFWKRADRTPGLAHLLGICHSCQFEVNADSFSCPRCHASFTTDRDRQHLGIGPSRPLPGQGDPALLAARAEPASVTTDTPRVHKAVVKLEQDRSPSKSQSASEIQLAQHARRWQRAWELERRNSWVMLFVCSVLILCALGYGVWKHIQHAKTHSPERSSGALLMTPHASIRLDDKSEGIFLSSSECIGLV